MLLVIAAMFVAGCQGQNVRVVQLQSVDIVHAGQPRTTNAVIVLTNNTYLVGYSERDRCPFWVCYVLQKTDRNAPDRPEVGFKIDSRTDEEDGRIRARVRSSDYVGSGYDKGHMAPSYGMGLCYGPAAQKQTFMMSNVVPQTPKLNRGMWKKIEMTAANIWSHERSEMWVTCGPVFGGSTNWIQFSKVDGNGATNFFNWIHIPEACYVIFLDETTNGPVTVSFIIPQEPAENADIARYFVSVDEVERQTGLDFFSELPDDVEDKMEAMK